MVFFRGTGDRKSELKASIRLRNALIFLGEDQRAIETFEKALLIASKLGDRKKVVKCIPLFFQKEKI